MIKRINRKLPKNFFICDCMYICAKKKNIKKKKNTPLNKSITIKYFLNLINF